MAFVNKQAINAEFFKGHNVILAVLCFELFQFSLYGTAALFKLFYGKVIPSISAERFNTFGNLLKLIL